MSRRLDVTGLGASDMDYATRGRAGWGRCQDTGMDVVAPGADEARPAAHRHWPLGEADRLEFRAGKPEDA